MLTKRQITEIAEGPISVEAAEKFFPTKKTAEQFLVDFNCARKVAINAEARGHGCCDTEFDIMFWNGQLFLDDLDLYELGIATNPKDFNPLIAHSSFNYPKMDATFHFYNVHIPTRMLCGKRSDNRQLFLVSYDWKNYCNISGWWLTEK